MMILTESEVDRLRTSMLSADGFKCGGKTFVSVDKMLEIIDKQDAYFKGDENGDVWINKRDLEAAVEALRGGEQEYG